MLRLGFVGTGVLAEAVVHGLQAVHGTDCEFHLSPRSEAQSRALAAAYDNVIRAASNEAVVAACDIVFLGVRPQQLGVLAGLPFRAGQGVVSFLAGTSLAKIRAIVSPATRVVRAIPLPSIRLHRGPIVLIPGDVVIEDLFRPLGDLILAHDEQALAALSVASGVMSLHFEMQNTLAGWLENRQIARPEAELYVRSLFAALGEEGLSATRRGETVRPESYETRGGLNERGRAFLAAKGWFADFSAALDAIEDHGRTLSEKAE